MNTCAPNCHCRCGTTNFRIHGEPLIRVYCHCTICQRFSQAPYGDITLFKSSDVDLPDNDLINFKSYQSPPILQRGKCLACQQPAIEYIKLPLGKMVIVPTSNIEDPAKIPKPSLHMFYDKRQADIDDDLPKYHFYLKSQLAFGQKLLTSLAKSVW